MLLAEIVQNKAPQAALGLAVGHHLLQPVQLQLHLTAGHRLLPVGVENQEFRRGHIPGGIQQDALRRAACPPRNWE